MIHLLEKVDLIGPGAWGCSRAAELFGISPQQNRRFSRKGFRSAGKSGRSLRAAGISSPRVHGAGSKYEDAMTNHARSIALPHM